MAKEFTHNIHEIYGVVDESDSSNWGLVLSKISWGNNSPCYDLRKFDITTLDENDKKFSKGVSFFHDDGVNRLTNLLLDMGFGDISNIEETLEKRTSLFTRKDNKNTPYTTIYVKLLEE